MEMQKGNGNNKWRPQGVARRVKTTKYQGQNKKVARSTMVYIRKWWTLTKTNQCNEDKRAK